MRVFLLLLLLRYSLTQMSEKTSIHKVLNTPENKDRLNFVAVFLLSTLNERFFKNRVEVSKQTWGHPVKHFFAVTGESPSERKILADKDRCHNRTDHYRKITRHISPPTREEIYICNGIHVLHLPYCDPSSWGPMVSFLI
jgi:hypothetical protein